MHTNRIGKFICIVFGAAMIGLILSIVFFAEFISFDNPNPLPFTDRLLFIADPNYVVVVLLLQYVLLLVVAAIAYCSGVYFKGREKPLHKTTRAPTV